MKRGTPGAAILTYLGILTPLATTVSVISIVNPDQSGLLSLLMLVPTVSALLAWPIAGVRPRLGRFGLRSILLPLALTAIVSLGYLAGGFIGALGHVGSGIGWETIAVALPLGILLALGEEIGWRGYLLPQLRRLFGFWPSALLVVVVWLLFHVPVILWGIYAPTDRPLGVALLWFVANIVLFSLTISALWEITHNVWLPAIAHGLWNLFIASILVQEYADSPPWLLGEFGFIPVIPLAITLLLSLRLSRAHRPAHWKSAVPSRTDVNMRATEV